MESFKNLWIWRYIRDRLPWYYEVANNRRPAKYLIAERIGVTLKNIEEENEEGLWAEFKRCLEEFIDLWQKVKRGEADIREMPRSEPSLLDLIVEIVKRTLCHCELCEWKCGVNRLSSDRLGFCRLNHKCRVSTYFHHLGEELPIRGTMGSGTIFFTSCNFRCAYCQNYDISRNPDNGIIFEPKHLAAAMVMLRLEGAHNINFVGGEPTPHLYTIVEAIRIMARKGMTLMNELSDDDLERVLSPKADFGYFTKMERGWALYNGEFNVPLLWNSNMYMTEKTLQLLRALIDIWLPDFKYGNNNCALRLSRIPRYFDVVSRNHKLIYDWGEDILIRHLVLPGHIECDTKPVLKWIAENMPGVLVNIMDQYRPECEADPSSPMFNPEFKELTRRLSRDELREVYRYARDLGLNFEIVTFEKRIVYFGDLDSLLDRLLDR